MSSWEYCLGAIIGINIVMDIVTWRLNKKNADRWVKSNAEFLQRLEEMNEQTEDVIKRLQTARRQAARQDKAN